MKENIKIELEMVENLIKSCKRTRNAEDEKLQSIERDVEECSKKIRKMKRKATRLRTISQYYNNMQNRIEECVQDLTEKEAQVCLIEDLIKRHNHELEKNKIELRKVEDNNNKDGGRKRSSRVFRKQIDEYDQLSPTIDGKSLQLLPIEQTVKHESHGNEILTSLLASSDPSKVVLDIIQNPIIPQCRKGDNVVIIDDGHIVILEQLMRISPQIKPCVREEATRLVLNLKAYIGENTENSVAVLGFLLLLSIYGLVPYFDEDEVLKLFGFVAQHKIAVELFGTMGLADKVYDFVQNLIRKKQRVEAVRFICAYNMANKNQSVDLLREHVQSAKVISESNCKKTNSIKIKDKARDQEIDTLRSVLQCISDNNVESVDLLNQIQGRILELSRQKRYFDV
ncbi:intracellular protein transport protein USO1 [Trifolium repens]|nr:intracellular protein transport protein USO1 [Trifolium repens]